jgi:cellulose synthase/poly-beta-1,6-N-acetylglucosamine synthase-like glycosyltransferase
MPDLSWLETLILIYFLIVNTFYGLVLLAAGSELTREQREIVWDTGWRILGAKTYPRISIVAPAYNEEASVVDAVKALLGHHYPEIEVVVVDDGSKDRTLEVLRENFHLVEVPPIYDKTIKTAELLHLYHSSRYPQLKVVAKANGGKADALNLGLQIAGGDLLCVIDADTLLEPEALLKLLRPFLESDQVVAAGGSICAVNGSEVSPSRVVSPAVPRSFLPGVQTVEYLRAFLLGRLGLNRWGANLIISGAFGLFRRDAVLATGGYAADTVGEDMELVVRLRRHGLDNNGPHEVVFIPDPVAWTEVPTSWKVLGRQRDRWQRGLCDSLWRHAKLALRPRYGAVGWIGYPYQLVVELISPLVEALGWLLLVLSLLFGDVNTPFAIQFLLVAYGYGLVLTVLAIAMEQSCFPRRHKLRDLLWLLWWGLVEPIGFRQFLVYHRLMGIINWFRGKHSWGKMERTGFRKTGA